MNPYSNPQFETLPFGTASETGYEHGQAYAQRYGRGPAREYATEYAQESEQELGQALAQESGQEFAQQSGQAFELEEGREFGQEAGHEFEQAFQQEFGRGGMGGARGGGRSYGRAGGRVVPARALGGRPQSGQAQARRPGAPARPGRSPYPGRQGGPGYPGSAGDPGRPDPARRGPPDYPGGWARGPWRGPGWPYHGPYRGPYRGPYYGPYYGPGIGGWWPYTAVTLAPPEGDGWPVAGAATGGPAFDDGADAFPGADPAGPAADGGPGGPGNGIEGEMPPTLAATIGRLPAAQRPAYIALGPITGALRDPRATGPGFYLIEFTVNGARRAYSGQTGNLRRRLQQHALCGQMMGLPLAAHSVYVAQSTLPDAQRRAVEWRIHDDMFRTSVGVLTNQRRELEAELFGNEWR